MMMWQTLNTQYDGIWVLHVLFAQLLDVVASVGCHTRRHRLPTYHVRVHVHVAILQVRIGPKHTKTVTTVVV